MKFTFKEKRFVILLIGLLVIDHCTKVLVFHFLDSHQYEYIISNFLWLERHVNPKPLEHLLISNAEILTNYIYWHRLASVILIPLLFWLYVYTRKNGIEKHKRYLLGLLLVAVWMLLVGQLENDMAAVEPNKYIVLIVVGVLAFLVLPMGLLIVNDNYFKTIILLASAANLGNLISLFYYPFEVVDMIGFRPTDRVYNLADIFGHSAELLFLLSPIYVYIIWRINKQSGNNNFVVDKV